MLAGQQGGAHGGGSGRADGAGQLGEPVPDDRGAEHSPGPGDRKRPEPAPEGLGQVGQVPGGPERDLPCLGVLGGERGDDRGQDGEPVAFGRMGADVADQGVQALARGLDHDPVDRLGAAHVILEAQCRADGGAADPVGAALVAEQESVAARPGGALPVPAGRHRARAGDDDHARGAEEGAGPGVVVIAGTGSMASGWNGESSARAGGHGFLLGDEGSAYWIGRAAVRAALRFQDQMGGSGPIHRAVTRAAGQSLDALIGDICTHPAERDRLTALAPAVTALAAEDAEASRIVLEAAEHLAELAESIRRRLGPLPVAGAGGVFRAPVIWDRFAELTGAVRPLAPAAVGAALLADQHACDA